MAEPRVIQYYLAGLAGLLPAPVVDEMADGLSQAYQAYRARGMPEDDAARAAVAEFGDVPVVVAAFTEAMPVRRVARRMLACGPAVGMVWGAALVSARFWTWPVPVAGRAAFGGSLVLAICLLAAGAFGRRFRLVSRAARSGLACMIILDAVLVGLVATTAPAISIALEAGMTVSILRVFYAVRNFKALRPT